jgi:hypothetical protein
MINPIKQKQLHPEWAQMGAWSLKKEKALGPSCLGEHLMCSPCGEWREMTS